MTTITDKAIEWIEKEDPADCTSGPLRGFIEDFAAYLDSNYTLRDKRSCYGAACDDCEPEVEKKYTEIIDACKWTFKSRIYNQEIGTVFEDWNYRR